jgi:nitrogenase molybdenum-iron protein alpha chain
MKVIPNWNLLIKMLNRRDPSGEGIAYLDLPAVTVHPKSETIKPPMMNLLKSKTAVIREKRLQTVTAYYGPSDTLLEEFTAGQLIQRVRTFSQDAWNDVMYSLKIIATIKDAAVVIHGASGCAVSRLTFRLKDENNGKWAITNLNERDSIMGSDKKLYETVKQVYQLHHPEIIFIVSTPIVAVNNDDIESVTKELEGELNIAVVPIYTDGFRSKTGVTGYDIVSHAVMKHWLPNLKTEKIPGLVNLISVSENLQDTEEIYRLLQNFGWTVNLFPQYTSLKNIKRLAQAERSIVLNSDEGNYPAIILKNIVDIPYFQTDIPVGITQTETWMTRIAEYAGCETKIHQWIQFEKEKYDTLSLRNIGQQKIFVNLPPALAFAVIKLAEELGHHVIGLKLPYLDINHLSQIEKIKENKQDFFLMVGDGQIFEEENMLRKYPPDLYLGKEGDYATAIRNGIPVIDLEYTPVVGFRGVFNVAKKMARTSSNLSFVQLLTGIETKTYSENWLKKNPGWFIKQEIK